MAGPDHIGIVGAGSLGSLLAAHLTVAGRSVTVVDSWFPHAEEIRSHGVEIQAPDETVRARLNAHNVDELDQIQRPVDVLLVAVEAYEKRGRRAVDGTAPPRHRHRGPRAERDARGVVLAPGGSRASGRLLRARTRRADCTWPGRALPSPEPPDLHLGELGAGAGPRLQPLAELFQAAGETEVADDLAAVKWQNWRSTRGHLRKDPANLQRLHQLAGG